MSEINLDTALCRSHDEATVPWDNIVDQIPTALIVISPQGKVIKYNQHAQCLLPSLSLQQPWVHVITDDFAPKEDDGCEVSLRNGRRVSIYVNSIQQGSGQLIVINDVTATRVYEEKRSIQERYSMMGKMLAHLTHQIRTPLASAKLYLKTMFHPNMTDEKRGQYLENIGNCHFRIESQINDLLLFAKNGNAILSKVTTNELITQTNSQCVVYFHNKDVEILPTNHEKDIFILCNTDAVIGALMNLIDNSFNAGASKVIINFKNNEDGLAITILDDGCGMSKETISKIFNPFFTTRAKGTGLGMAVVHSVVKEHKGDIEVTSKEQQGTQFIINFPKIT